jgi:glycosyltransferase involved in cell wall biosynthesis
MNYLPVPNISIVMTTYNSSKYIKECIESVLDQNFKNYEFIIVDDGSTDNTIEIIQSYEDSRIILISNAHNYIQSLNIGINKAQSKYIARMDSDDIMLMERLKLQYDFMESHPQIDICGGAAQTFDQTTKTTKLNVSTNHIDIVLNFMFGNSIIHPSVIIKRDILKIFPCKKNIYECYNPQYIYAEDYKMWTDLAIKGYQFANIPEVIIKYRISENQVTQMKNKEMMVCSRKISAEYIESVVDIILESDKTFKNILSEIIDLYKNKNISFNSLCNILYYVYKEFLSTSKLSSENN